MLVYKRNNYFFKVVILCANGEIGKSRKRQKGKKLDSHFGSNNRKGNALNTLEFLLLFHFKCYQTPFVNV